MALWETESKIREPTIWGIVACRLDKMNYKVDGGCVRYISWSIAMEKRACGTKPKLFSGGRWWR